MLTLADGYDPSKPEQFDWLMVEPPELSAAALEIAAEVRVLSRKLWQNELAETRAGGLRLALRLIARHAKRE